MELAFYINPLNVNRASAMNALAEAGIKHVGIDGTDWDPENQLAEINRFKGDLINFGLKLCSMHACYPILADSSNEAPPDLYEAQVKELRTFGLLGGKTAVYHACCMRDVPPDDIDKHIEKTGWETFVEWNAKTLKKLAREASKYGIIIVLENVWHSIRAKSVAGFLPIIKTADEPNIGVCLDSGHAHLAGQNVANEVRLAGKLLKDTHFHDNAGIVNGKIFDQHLPPGLGTINWQGVITVLKNIKFPGPVVFEGVFGPGDSIEKGRFRGQLSYNDLIEITVKNWRALELFSTE